MKQTKHDLFTTVVSAEFRTECVAEHRFHPTRKWRFDYAMPELKIAIEVEGGVFTRGRHTRGTGFIKDMEKYNAAAAMGWLVLRCTPSQQFSKTFFATIAQTVEFRTFAETNYNNKTISINLKKQQVMKKHLEETGNFDYIINDEALREEIIATLYNIAGEAQYAADMLTTEQDEEGVFRFAAHIDKAAVLLNALEQHLKDELLLNIGVTDNEEEE